MIFDPSQITLGQVSSTARDLAIVGTLITCAWKARGWYEAGASFFARCIKHMDVMEAGMKTLLENHMTHIEADLAKLTGRSIVTISQTEHKLEQ